ncbi:uncharacterized protein JCM6883_000513 [Sporobolomyces salmoneus]|uniref:uncharacterized protein n=1 Tax=Sporobolomyces salmoneus TaxID=183962 RepID=UPI00317F1CBC
MDDVDRATGTFDGVQPQPGLFAQVLPVLLPEAQKVPTKDRKLVVVGLTYLLTRSSKMLNEPHVRVWSATMESLLKLLILPLAISKTTSAADEEIEIADLDEVAAGLGYQAPFSKLGASEKPKEDPVAWVQPGKLPALMQAVNPQFSAPFTQYLTSNGIDLA